MALELLSNRKNRSIIGTPFIPLPATTTIQRHPPKLISIKQSYPMHELKDLSFNLTKSKFSRDIVDISSLRSTMRPQTSSRNYHRSPEQIESHSRDSCFNQKLTVKTNALKGSSRRAVSITPSLYRKFRVKNYQPLFKKHETIKLSSPSMDYMESSYKLESKNIDGIERW